jgi:hypothetical protein
VFFEDKASNNHQMTMKYDLYHKDHKAAAKNNHEVGPEKCVAAVDDAPAA